MRLSLFTLVRLYVFIESKGMLYQLHVLSDPEKTIITLRSRLLLLETPNLIDNLLLLHALSGFHRDRIDILLTRKS